MAFKYLTDPKGKTNVLEIIREGLEALEARAHYLTPNAGAVIGPPSSGAWETDELYVDSQRSVWLCYAGGTPGSWRQIVPAVLDAFPGGSVPSGYEVVRDDQGRRKYRWNGTAWIRINRYIHTQVSQASTWSVNHNLGYKPGTITIWVDDRQWFTRIDHVDDDNLTAKFDSAQAGQLIVE